MAAIMEYTQFENAIDNAMAVKMTFIKPKTLAETVFIQLSGRNTIYKVGEVVTYIGSNGVRFSGKIYYIYQGATAYNLYIKHKDWMTIGTNNGGSVIKGIVATPAIQEPEYVPKYDKPIDELKEEVTGGPGTAIKTDKPLNGGLLAKVNLKTLGIIGAAIAGLFVAKKLFK